MDSKSLYRAILLVLVVSLTALAYDRSEFLFLDEIEIGMTGVGKTIVADDEISEFDVEILGIIDHAGDLSDFIVVRLGGQAIGRAGGIAQGMSGSPIYVDGKLIGALSRSGSWSKEILPIGLVTPIEPMLHVLDAAGDRPMARAEDHAVLHGVSVVESEEVLTATGHLGDIIVAHPVSTPLLTHGLSERSTAALLGGIRRETPLLTLDRVLPIPHDGIDPRVSGLATLGLSVIPAAGGPSGRIIDPSTLEPGSSIGVGLVTGDISIGALGTLTYREDDTLIGFGHRFLYNGASHFPMTTVSIIDTMKSLESSYKLGTLGPTVGSVFEDRIAAIGGRLGVPFEGIDVDYDVIDLDRSGSRRFAIETVDEPRLMPELLLATGFEAIDTTLDRIGQGTVVVTYSIDGEGMPESLERTDAFFSSTDIAIYPPLQLASIVSILQYNEFADPEITRIESTMEFTEKIMGIAISDLEIEYLSYAPGETLQFRLTLQTYQGDVLVREGELAIPEGLLADHLLVRAYGGPRYLESGEEPDVFTGIDDLISAIESFPGYQTLTVELFAVDPFSAWSDALFGVTEVSFEFPGYVVYGEREVSALLLYSEEEGNEPG